MCVSACLCVCLCVGTAFTPICIIVKSKLQHLNCVHQHMYFHLFLSFKNIYIHIPGFAELPVLPAISWLKLKNCSEGPFWEALSLQSPGFQWHPWEQLHLFFWQKGYMERMSRKKALFSTYFPLMLLFPDEPNKQKRFLNNWVTCTCFRMCLNVYCWREESSFVPEYYNLLLFVFFCSAYFLREKSAELSSLLVRSQKLHCFLEPETK